MTTARKDSDFSVRFNLSEFDEYYDYRKDATYALTNKRRPRHARNAHFESGYEKYIRADIGKRRTRKEDKRGFRIAERGENTRGDVVQENEG